MKRTNALIAAVLVTSMLTSCGGTDTAEMTSAESTVSETTESEVTEATTISETDTLSAESEKTTAETSAEPVESVSDTEAVEETETAHWDTIVYDTTIKTDITGWELKAENIDKSNTTYTVSEAVELSGIPDVVTSYLYENSSTYKMCTDNNKEIRGIVSGVKDFDSDGVDETFYAVNYLLYDEGWTPSIGRLGAFPSDIVIYDTEEGKVYPCDGEEMLCIVYVMSNGKEVPYNVPSLAYLDTVMRGYAINNLPPKFLYEALATAYKKSNK